jgi:hypothetical protein
MLREAFGEHSLSRTAGIEWHSRFETGRVSVEDDESSEQPSTRKTTENVEEIRELIHEDRRRTIREFADTAAISYGRKRPEFWGNHNWLLHHDNAPAHTSLKTTEFVTNNNMVIIPHPPYLPD